MKKLLLILTVLVGAAFTISCEGPQGPPGRPGPTILPAVREIKIDFNENTSKDNYHYTNPVKVYIGDAILVYFLDGSTNNGDPLWRQLPANYTITENNVTNSIEYYSTWSLSTTTITADATTQLGWFRNTHAGNFTKGMIFRIVYIPGDDPVQGFGQHKISAEQASLSYEEAVKKYNLQDVKVIREY